MLNRTRTARAIVDAWARPMPTSTVAPYWETVFAALDHIPDLTTEITRLRAQVARLTRDHADLTAAARATLSAEQDGEGDPLWYVRDALAEQAERGAR
ncbi:hypothetical protein [Spongiactinospora sp. 9N601]|uniref:hypothetical protein n=1 Tax=Spongiactinospora sp. 9N601 TaxID=3375149 RepID=UPI0037B854AD